MLERMKQWIKQISSQKDSIDSIKDITRNREKIDKVESDQEFQAKMQYQYPKSGAFRFPLIPDGEGSHKINISQRSKRRTDQNNEQKVLHKQNNEENLKAKTFRPSEIPSPIYGFQQRPPEIEEKIEEVPAYVRLQRNKLDDNDHDKINRFMDDNSQDTTENVKGISYTENTEDVQDCSSNDEKSSTNNQVISIFQDHSQNKKNFNNQVEDSPMSIVEGEKNDNQQEAEETQQIEQQYQGSKRNRMPFNVIMTPRDKRARDKHARDKQNQMRQHANVEKIKSEKEVIKTEEAISIKEVKSTNEQPPIPPIHLLNDPPLRDNHDEEWINEQTTLLETVLMHFHVKAKVINAMKGPSVTRFEVQPEPGVKVSKITNLTDDIKLGMAATDIRMEAPIPGKNAIGIEIPNKKAEAVGLQEILESASFKSSISPLTVGLGLDIGGTPVVTDLKKMPHGLIAGATGSGKSVCINTILVSLLYKAHYEDVKFLLIDPKMVELAPYNDLPHLVAPVITDVKAATSALKWAVKEMDERYEKFVEEGVRDIDRFNQKIKEKKRFQDKMPYIVVVIDELADLMMVSPQDVEDAICRIAQKARACGIHLLLATQRPSVDVITGLIKANIPTRTAFSVSSQVDSRTIIDTSGAEKLLGKGDMLFLANGSGKTQRLQGAFVSDEEIERITNYMKKVAKPNYLFEQEDLIQQISFEEEGDELFDEAVSFVLENNGASASLLQRRFKVGYNRAARLIDRMEEYNIISEQKGSKPRDILMTEDQVNDLLNQYQ